MVVLDVFSRRGKPMPDVYQYDSLTEKLRNQLALLLQETSRLATSRFWSNLATAVRQEHGKLHLSKSHKVSFKQTPDDRHEVKSYLLEATLSEVFDLLELYFSSVGDYDKSRVTQKDKIAAVEELNQRFLIAGCGYQYSLETMASFASIPP